MGVFLMILGLTGILGGLSMIRNPASGWRRNEGWKTEGESEPSEAYLLTVKFGGIATIVLGFVLIGSGILNISY